MFRSLCFLPSFEFLKLFDQKIILLVSYFGSGFGVVKMIMVLDFCPKLLDFFCKSFTGAALFCFRICHTK